MNNGVSMSVCDCVRQLELSGLKSTKEKQGAKVSSSLRQAQDEPDKVEQRPGRETLI